MSVNSGSLLKRHGYRQLKKIGEGSFGQAILVESESDAKKLVCKMINVSQASPKEVADTRKEAQLLAAFKHPFIVEYCANFLDNGYLCILMTFCEGGDLTSQVEAARKAKRYIPEAQVLRWITQALLALKYIHDKHVLHRDLKSGNFFLSKAGNLKMGDFGIAKVLNSTQAVARTQIGTPYYLSPEVCQDKPYAWASDIWAMGIILFELCALKLPFDGGQNMIVLVQAIVRGKTPSLPDEYSDFVRHLCHEMLNKNPGARPSAGAILARPELQRIVQGFFEEARQKAEKEGRESPAGGEVQAEGTGPYQNGDLVEYYSNTHKSWLPAVITNTEGNRVMIDVKPNSWMSPEQQSQHLRHRGSKAKPSYQAEACSTMQFEQLLDEEAGEGAKTPAPRSKPATPLPTSISEEPESQTQSTAPTAGVNTSAPSLDEECTAILEELEREVDGLGTSGDGAADTSPKLPLSQEELDLLNDSLLNN